jgi:Zn-dependent peptidase ImmA (M78 family)
MGTQKEKARERAREILRGFRLEAIPVPVDRIAKSLGISLQYAPLDEELSGMAFIKDGTPVIGVNALHHPNRQRFTLAHEIGHHALHAHLLEGKVHVDKVILKRDPVAAAGIDLNEIEANAFASELLMPDPWFSDAIQNGIDIGDEARIASLAKRFRVSVAAIQYRLLSQ